jgi:hypothetical protein
MPCHVMLIAVLGILLCATSGFVVLNRRSYSLKRCTTVVRDKYQAIEDNLFGLDGSGKAKIESQASGVGKLLQNSLVMLGKVPITRLRELIVINGGEDVLPSEDADINDLDSHVNAAMDVVWSKYNGDWENFYLYLQKELKESSEKATVNLETAVELTSLMSEGQIKHLLRMHGGPNALPKLRTRRATGTVAGKFGKGDFIAALIDVLRAANGNDYGKVAEILQNNAKSLEKKGFQ